MLSGSMGNSMVPYLIPSYVRGVKTKAGWKLNNKEPVVTHVGWEGWGLCFCDLHSDFFLMLRQNYEVNLVSVLLSPDHRRLHLMMVLCDLISSGEHHSPL